MLAWRDTHPIHMNGSACSTPTCLTRSRGGGGGQKKPHAKKIDIDSLTYVTDESDVWRAHEAMEHYQHRGKFWNAGKHETIWRYVLVASVGILQAMVAYFTNISSTYFIKVRRAQSHLISVVCI